jgi:hypothetical protein
MKAEDILELELDSNDSSSDYNTEDIEEEFEVESDSEAEEVSEEEDEEEEEDLEEEEDIQVVKRQKVGNIIFNISGFTERMNTI